MAYSISTPPQSDKYQADRPIKLFIHYSFPLPKRRVRAHACMPAFLRFPLQGAHMNYQSVGGKK